ncbi:ABC transporter permease [Pseudomonas sp. W22_MBD1_FP4]|uniref:ABC transporter permease n=1 Tax=Pseudomonas sp. W22_MBD1_FP4 TaxID=3240272 RepID=UPI003F96B4C8
MNSGFKYARGCVLPLLLLVAWDYASSRGASGAYALVPLAQIGAGLLEVIGNGELLTNLLASLLRTSEGLLFGVVAGVLLGAAMALSVWGERLIAPLFHSLRQVPMLAWIPLIALWFGNGESSKVLIIALAACYPMALNTFEGLRQVDHRYLEVAQALVLTRRQRFALVLLPSAMPSLCTGVLQAIAFAWVTAVGSELFLSAGPGLGNLMINAEAGARMEIILLCVISIAALGYGMSLLFTCLSRYLLRWRP